MTIIPRVVDLSHYDDVQDAFAGAKHSGIWGVINKVTESVGVVDASFGWRRQPAQNAGMRFGAYHFLRPGRIQQQADWFLSHCGNLNGLLLALDHEDRNVPLSDARAWLGIVHDKTGRWPKLYSGFLIKEQLGQHKDPFWNNIDLWLAQYAKAPTCPPQWKTPWLWQYTGDGTGPTPHNIPGIVVHGGKGIDINHFAGTLDDLTAKWAA